MSAYADAGKPNQPWPNRPWPTQPGPNQPRPNQPRPTQSRPIAAFLRKSGTTIIFTRMGTIMQTEKKFDYTGLPFDSFYIDGKWVTPHSDARISVVNPISEQIVFHTVDADEVDMDCAVKAARTAFDNGPWPKMTMAKRAEIIQRFADRVEARKDDLAQVWSAQIGIQKALAARFAPSFAGIVRQYLSLVPDFAVEQALPTMFGGTGLRILEPVGVVAAIAPWNVPTNAMLNKIVPALLAGCPVIMKPAPETPAEAYILAQCGDDAGIPAGVLNLVVAGRTGSNHLVNNAGVDKVSFTGSVATGKHIAKVCAERIARFTLELGGKSAAIILDDYDLAAAVPILVNGMCSLSGQNCGMLSRILVHADRKDELVMLLKEKAETVEVGPEKQLGPIATARQLERIKGYVEAGLKEGATLVTGGQRVGGAGDGFFFAPTIFADVSNDMVIAQEEIFGPVLCVIAYNSVDEAIAIANDSRFGLVGAVFTHDRDKALDVARRVRTGTMGQNGPKVDFGIGFGGFKQSGIGREGGIQGLKSYFETKTILLEPESPG